MCNLAKVLLIPGLLLSMLGCKPVESLPGFTATGPAPAMPAPLPIAPNDTPVRPSADLPPSKTQKDILARNGSPNSFSYRAGEAVLGRNVSTVMVAFNSEMPGNYAVSLTPENAALPPNTYLSVSSRSAGTFNVSLLSDGIPVTAHGDIKFLWTAATYYNPSPVPPIEKPSLVGWWPADGNGNDIIGGAKTSLHNVTYSVGKIGQAFTFAGNTGIYVEVPDDAALNPAHITVECWFKTAGISNFWAALAKKCGTGFRIDEYATNGYTLEMTRPNEINFIVYVNGVWVHTPAFTVQSDTWYHVAGTYDGLFVRLYINGELFGERPATGDIIPSVNPLRFGGDASNPATVNRTFNGLIDEVKIYNQALSLAEIKADFSGQPQKPVSNMTVVAPFVPVNPPPSPKPN